MEGEGQLPMETRYTCASPPPDNRKNRENFALAICKNKKNLDILPLKRVKFEVFARVMAQIQENQ